ncbi:hypothetical protein [Paenibacillus montanisoli]|uniref:Uncharacterized protein n=1 Tax=Paenibacillus montanisoli TaxID=2081970 RepID=A0A328U7C6_9BACL|nr:hypothetical protein [Paenibacillus montanisoli]RAP75994.1 hypothetical protein DL346_11245 [Paenibacillus montanisoli]
MWEDFSQKLADAKERVHRLQKAQRRREELKKRQYAQERAIVEYELQLEAEQADVDKLTGLTLTNLFHTVLRSKAEQLELERQQALAAALRLQEEKKKLEDTKANLLQVGEMLASCSTAEHDYKQLMAAKESALRSAPESSLELAAMEEQIADQTVSVKEIQEALTAGQRVMASLEDASNSLEKAENWGKWDLWGGGGMITHHAKHDHIDNARNFIHQANHQLLEFRDELKDLERTIHVEIDISGTLKMADFWFDGLITDWIVQGRIQSSQEQTLQAIHNVRIVVNQLRSERSAAEAALSALRNKRQTWIEETKMD